MPVHVWIVDYLYRLMMQGVVFPAERVDLLDVAPLEYPVDGKYQPRAGLVGQHDVIDNIPDLDYIQDAGFFPFLLLERLPACPDVHYAVVVAGNTFHHLGVLFKDSFHLAIPRLFHLLGQPLDVCPCINDMLLQHVNQVVKCHRLFTGCHFSIPTHLDIVPGGRMSSP